MDRIRSPYVFVPTSEHVVFDESLGDGLASAADSAPSTPGRAPIDHPFADGVSGTFTVEVEALTPVLVRGERPGDKGQAQVAEFARAPDGAYAVPGSSLRGMLRNVVEIASLAKMSRVADRRYGVRDLYNPPLYVEHMSAIKKVDGKSELVPQVCAAWLTRDPAADQDEGADYDVVAWLNLCHFFKVEYGLLAASGLAPRNYRPGDRQSAPAKYEAWRRDGRPLAVRFGARLFDRHGAQAPGRPPRIGHYGLVDVLGAQGTREGTLVFTGQPSAWRPGDRKSKHHDFVFADAGELPVGTQTLARLPVSRALYRAFEQVHADSGEQHRLETEPNEEWKFWRDRFDKGDRVPVFYLLEGEAKVRAIGLAMMFRLAYQHGVGDVLVRTQPQVNDNRIDLAESIFGRVPDGADDRRAPAADPDKAAPRTLAGRVSIGLARAVGEPQPILEVRAILGAPKGSYYPAYIAQKTDASGRRLQGRYKTLMDGDSLLAGWKRYRPQDVRKPHIPASVKSDKVFTRLRPLPAGTRFRAEVRVHNLRLHELGALLWALDFGGSVEAVHGLGLAKPLGYGRVRLRVTDWQVHALADWPADPFADVRLVDGDAARSTAVAVYERWMEAACRRLGVAGGWRDSEQVRELLASARPLPPGSDDGRWMMLDHPDDRNEFQAAKRAELVLPLPSGKARTRVAAKAQPSVQPGMATPRTAGATAVVAPAAVEAAAWHDGQIVGYADFKVRFQLAGGQRLPPVPLDMHVFPTEAWGKARLTGNDLRVGLPVRLMVDGVRVMRAEPLQLAK